MQLPRTEKILKTINGDDYKTRSIGEYWFVRSKYEKLHRMIVEREAGKLDFTPNCPMEQWKAQAAAMGEYLHQLEIKACYEDVNFDDLYYDPCEVRRGN